MGPIKLNRLLTNSSGLATADFLFAMIMTFSVFMLLMALSGALVVAESAQYIAFSSSRAFASSHKDPGAQMQMAQTKFDSLIKKSALGSFFSSTLGWFELKLVTKDSGDSGKLQSYFGFNSPIERLRTTGLSFQFNAKILDIRLPFLGKTSADENSFRSNISGMINREPSQQECLDQIGKSRYELLMQLDSARYGNPTYGGKANGSDSSYVPIEDNGC